MLYDCHTVLYTTMCDEKKEKLCDKRKKNKKKQKKDNKNSYKFF